MIDNKIIAKRFHKAYQSYNDNAHIQYQMVLMLMDKITKIFPTKNIQNVLEIGCGTGNLTRALLNHFFIQNLYLNDLYDDIKNNTIPNNFNAVNYYIGDIKYQILKINKPLDLIVSNAVLQWIYPLDNLLADIFKALKKDGYFVFSSFSVDNLIQIKNLTNQGLSYYTMTQLKELLENRGFYVMDYQEQYQNLYFDNPISILKHLKETGVTGINQEFRWTKQTLNKFIKDYEYYIENHQYPLTYHPIYMVAKKCM